MKNILLKSFDGPHCKEIIEATFSGIQLGSVYSIMDNTEQKALLQCTEHIWIPAEPQRKGEYASMNWNECLPLDEHLIESMRHCEAYFMTMISRYAVSEEIVYDERKRQYFDHLRFWNNFLETKDITLLLSNHPPHQCYDYVLYELCKLKGIPTLLLGRTDVMEAFFINTHWDTPAKEAGDLLQNLEAEFVDPTKEVPLNEKYETYFESETTREESPWFLRPPEKHLHRKNFLLKWTRSALHVIRTNPLMFIQSVFSLTFWKRKRSQHKTKLMYDQNTQEPDMTADYIYVPLHMQPEASTCPKAGAFTDQERIIELLAFHLPAQVKLYVKEHPNQGELLRNCAFYQRLLDIPQVQFVPKNFSTFTLIENAKAIATCTGTAGFESLFRAKPVLMFGHRFYQYARGVYCIHSSQDCKEALKKILENGEVPTIRDARLFLKSVQDTAAETYVGYPESKYSIKQQANIMGEYIREKMRMYGIHL